MKSKKSPTAKKIKLRIRFGPKDITIDVTNKSSIAECKSIFLKEVEMEEKSNPDNTRFFCLGKELKNDFFIYSYDIVDEMVV
jgi:hypothetical protein